MSAVQPHRPTLLFLHGLSGSSSAWLPIERMLEPEYNIVSLDLRGHGKSRKSPRYDDYTPETLAADVQALITHLQLPSLTIVSHSLGTLIALALIRTKPREVMGAIFLSAAFGVCAQRRARILRPAFSLAAALVSLMPFSAAPRGQVDYTGYRPTGDWTLRRIIADVRQTSLRVYAYCLCNVFRADLDPWWQDIRVRSLFVHGARDSVIPLESAQRLHALVRDSRLVVLADANHILPVNDPEDIAALIREFVPPERNER